MRLERNPEHHKTQSKTSLELRVGRGNSSQRELSHKATTSSRPTSHNINSSRRTNHSRDAAAQDLRSGDAGKAKERRHLPGSATHATTPPHPCFTTRMADPAVDVAQDDVDTCRICSMPAEDDHPLFYPCKCSGTIKYIHQDW